MPEVVQRVVREARAQFCLAVSLVQGPTFPVPLKGGGTMQEIEISITRHILPAVVIVMLVIWLIKRRKKPPSSD